MSPERLDAVSASQLLDSGALTAERLLAALLERIGEREPAIGAWEHIGSEGALRRARELDRNGRSGPLHGIPVGVKDIIDTADQPTTYGSPIYAGHRPTIDAAGVAATRAAGGIVLGKTVTAEFAHRKPGKTRNPLDIARTPGGSSSGSAAAVADFMVPLALGTQTTASVIRPASYCGVVGYRPSYGLMSCAGVKPSSPSLDTLGIFARSVADCALFRDALLGAPVRLPAGELGRAPRLGFCRTPFWSKVEPSAARLIEQAVSHLSGRGGEIREVELPPDIAGLSKAHRVVSSYEFASSLATERLQHAEGLSALLRDGKMAEGLGYTPEDYFGAVANLEQGRARAASLFGDLDVLLAPSVSGIAGVGLESTGPAEFSSIWTALHGPCMSIPLPERIDGMPIGLQLVARRGDDLRLAEVAEWVVHHLD
jgi:Asp-tRNA(Asn)/Glu-tRNA(Gln) amidotransferase A subunit family amidase